MAEPTGLGALGPGALDGVWDVVVVGGGHNGLTAAAYLARAGLDVVVLERSDWVGGAAGVEEPWPGYRVSPCAYVVGLLHEQVVSDLGLEGRGLRTTVFDPQLWVPLDDGSVYVEWVDFERTAAGVERWSPGAGAGLKAKAESGREVFEAIRGNGDDWDDLWLRIDPPHPDEVRERLSPSAARAVFEDSMVGYLGRFFDDPRLVDALAAPGGIGETRSPLDSGTAWVHLHHSLGRAIGDAGSWGLVHGGIGVVSATIADAALEAGASVVTGAPVSSIRPGWGVVLEDSTTVRSRAVVSNADPVRTAGLLGDPVADEVGMLGASAKVNFALSEPVPFPDPAARTAMVNVGASADLLHESALAARDGRLSDRLWAELYTQTTVDPTVAPPGKHLLSCFVQYAPYHLAGGWDDPSRRALVSRVTDEIERHAPGFSGLVEHTEVSAPPDIEEKVGLTGGHIFQGDCTPERMWSERPDYQTSHDSVYLCGAGTHPGGSVIGVNGRNAAMRVLRDFGELG